MLTIQARRLLRFSRSYHTILKPSSSRSAVASISTSILAKRISFASSYSGCRMAPALCFHRSELRIIFPIVFRAEFLRLSHNLLGPLDRHGCHFLFSRAASLCGAEVAQEAQYAIQSNREPIEELQDLKMNQKVLPGRGGKRLGEPGRPKSDLPHCSCGRHTQLSAEQARLKCARKAAVSADGIERKD